LDGLIPECAFNLFPLHAERRVGEQVVEPLAGEPVLGERVAQGNVRGVLALEHHVGAADGVGLGIEFLAEDLQPGLRMERAQMVLRHAEHAAGAAGRIEHRLDHAGLGEQLVVLDEQQVHHQPDDLPRREVPAGGLVGQLGEPPDQLLVQVAHLQIRHGLGMQVDAAEAGDDQIEQV
jgi:hypothetical protein